MGNLGDYQKITTMAKAVGGPKNLLALIFLAGSAVTLGVGSIIYFIKRKKGEENSSQIELKRIIISKSEANKYKTLIEDESNEGVVFNVGDEFEVLAEDGDVVLIDKKNDESSPYYVSREFLEKISSYRKK